MYKVNATFKQQVELTEDQARDITVQFLRKQFDIPDGAYVKGDDLVVDVEFYTSHSWFETHTVRKVTEQDKAVLLITRQIYEKTY